MTQEARSAPAGDGSRFRFGPFAVDLRSGELFRLGKRVPLQRLPFELLALLLRGKGEIVTRNALRAGLWPQSTHVDFEHGLNTAMRKLRRALGDSADKPVFVETIPARVYRLCVSAESMDPSEELMGEVDALSSTISRIARPPFFGRARELLRLEARLSLAAELHGGGVLYRPPETPNSIDDRLSGIRSRFRVTMKLHLGILLGEWLESTTPFSPEATPGDQRSWN